MEMLFQSLLQLLCLPQIIIQDMIFNLILLYQFTYLIIFKNRRQIKQLYYSIYQNQYFTEKQLGDVVMKINQRSRARIILQFKYSICLCFQIFGDVQNIVFNLNLSNWNIIEMSSQHMIECQQGEVAGFVGKTYEILNNQQFSKIIFWAPSGMEFIIKDSNKFQEIVLPKYFRHKKINSFIRQLNMYGFHKARKENTKSIFTHPNFIQGRQDLLKNIKRKMRIPSENQPITPSKQDHYQWKEQSEKIPSTPATCKEGSSNNRINSFQTNQDVSMRQFLSSMQSLGSRMNLGYCQSLNKISHSLIGGTLYLNQHEDPPSIEENMENQNQKQKYQDTKKIQNPSYFFFPHQK